MLAGLVGQPMTKPSLSLSDGLGMTVCKKVNYQSMRAQPLATCGAYCGSGHWWAEEREKQVSQSGARERGRF